MARRALLCVAMSFEFFLGPPASFRDWSKDQWDEYWENGSFEESVSWKAAYVGRFAEVVANNLESGSIGSRFPLLSRAQLEDTPGWYHSELPALLEELNTVSTELARLPIDHPTLQFDNPAGVREWVDDFKRYYPKRPVNNLCELFFRFLDDSREFIQTAMGRNCGIVVSY
jgi:hypothetical protein